MGGENQSFDERALLKDLQHCEDENIRIPGSVQPHGFLLALDEDDKIVVASENAADLLGKPLKLILGAGIDVLFDRELLAAIRHHASRPPAGTVLYLGSFHLCGELYSVVTHIVNGRRVLEFEKQDRLVGPEMMNAVITNFVGTLSKLTTENDLRQSIVQQVADLTGFDRVLLYSFDEFGHGTVLNEVNNGRLPSYLDLRFPGTDIPQQARALYLANTVRIIPDVSYKPSPLSGLPGEHTRSFDMSSCVLRSVSPIHLAYMRNMRTLSSMSLSVVVEGRLWGLISGHHAEPRAVPYLVRSACDMLTKIVGNQLSAFRTSTQLEETVHYHAIQHKLLTRIAATVNYMDTLEGEAAELLEVTSAGGAALWMDDRLTCHGKTPTEEQVKGIIDWLDTQPELEVFSTHCLGTHLPWAGSIADAASGMIAIRISDVRRRYILWFRPEIVQTVKWAGDPGESLESIKLLEPRHSFELWKQIVRGRSVEWSGMQIESAREFRSALMTISLRRAEEEAQLAEARFDQLTHSLPTKIFTANDSGELTYVNQQWHDAGLNEKGRWFEGGRLIPEDEARCADAWSNAIREGILFEEELRFQSPDGEPRWNLVRAVPFRGLGAVRAGWVGMCADLTERKEREAAIRMAEKLAITGRMTSVIAHEINNPLEAITNLMYLLRQEVDESNRSATEYITMVESELIRISGITKQTLRWTRENQERFDWMALDEMFEEVLRLFHGKSNNRHVTVQTLGDRGLRYYGMVGQIRQVVANLVSNAIDASHIGGTIMLRARSEARGLVIEATDHGAGMDDHVRSQIFKPFFTTKGDLGNGLGLYISHEIVERHGGHIEVDTQPGHGTTVRVVLPLLETDVILPVKGLQ